jgi:hypothetical protein
MKTDRTHGHVPPRNQTRDLLADCGSVVCERPNAERPVLARVGREVAAASRHLHDAVGDGDDETPNRGVQRCRRGDVDRRMA